MLKHIKDIRSPIAVAQQKHAARKASSVISNDTTATQGHTKTPSTSRSIHRPPRLEVQDLSTPSALSSALSPQPGWPDQNISSPAVDGNSRGEEPGLFAPVSAGTQAPLSTHLSGTTLGASSDAAKSGNSELGDQPPSASTSAKDIPVASTGISYAVAIYPYMAEHEDEFDVVV